MHELVAEAAHINVGLSRMMQLAPAVDEAPVRLHSHDVDAGGAPELHPAFIRWLGSLCTCGRAAICDPNCRFMKDKVLGHLSTCEPACNGGGTRFRASNNRNHPQRMRRALRQVRRLNPKAYDLVYLVVARHYTFEAAIARLNADNEARGLPQRSDAEFGVLWVSGAAMLTSAF